MTSKAGSTTVLLGAGASKDAGVPLSMELTQEITEDIESTSRRGRTALALNIVIGAMIAHQTAMGRSVSEGVDVEDLFTAIQMLAARDNLEVAPFIYSWNPWLATSDQPLPERLPWSWERSFRLAVKDDRDAPQSLARTFEEGVKALTGRAPSENVFVRLEKEMIASLRKRVEVKKCVDYLRPLVQDRDGPVQVATLNYDQSVELMATRNGFDIDTGIEAWTGDFEWYWRKDAEIKLLKLHGSTNWFIGLNREMPGPLEEDRVIVSTEPRFNLTQSDSLCVVFGRRGKLRSEGPFLAMLREFDQFLAVSDRLVIVGYSFRDEHINLSIRRWFNRTNSPEVVIVDPSFPKPLNDLWILQPFLRELVEAMSYRPNMTSALRLKRGHLVIREPARTGLKKL